MAGIGFELKKMFNKKGLLSKVMGYGYAGVIVTGPMILGIILLLGIRLLATAAGAADMELELLNSMVTVTLLASLIVSSFFSMVSTRYVADQLYEEKNGNVLPSFWGSVSIMIVVGGILYGGFLVFSGIEVLHIFLCFIFFGVLNLVWNEMYYLTAIKDYKGIMITFLVSICMALGLGYLLSLTKLNIITAMMISVCVAYGIMSVVYYHLMASYFESGSCSSMLFVKWFDKYPELKWVGLFSSLGMYGHLVIMWTSPVRKQVFGLFYGAPVYDISALLAFFSILVTSINFVTSVEVNFYPRYRVFFGLFNDGGSYTDIEQAGIEMKTTLIQELAYTFTKQFFATIIFIVAGTLLLPKLPLGLTEDMLGIYRVLCIGYAFFAIGNCIMLIQLYFSDNKGALLSVTAFMLTSNIATFVMKEWNIKYYGVGFLLGGIVFTVVSLGLMLRYLYKLVFNVLGNQPIVAYEKRGLATKLSEKYQRRYLDKFEKIQEEGKA